MSVNYEIILNKLNIKMIEDKITNFNSKLQKYLDENNDYKVVQLIYLMLYEMDYIFNITEYLNDQIQENKIYDLINQFNQDLINNKDLFNFLFKIHNKLKGSAYIICNKIIKNFFYSQNENYKSIIQELNKYKNNIENQENKKINVNLLLSNDQILTETPTDIINTVEYSISENNDLSDNIMFNLDKHQFNFLIDKIKKKEDRDKLLNLYFSSLLEFNENNKIYNLINFYLNKNLFENQEKENNKLLFPISKENKNKEIKELRQSDFYLFQNVNLNIVNEILKDLIQSLNDNYIKNYINVLEQTSNISDNIIENKKPIFNLSDIEHFIYQKKFNIEKEIGLIKTDDILDLIFNICFLYFNIEFKPVKEKKYNYNIYLKNQNGLIGQWIFKFDKNKNVFKTNLNILNHRFKFKDNGKENLNSISLIISCCCGDFIKFNKVVELIECVGEALSYILNFQESIIYLNNKNKIFSSLFKLIFFDDNKGLFNKYIKEKFNNSIIDLINEYLDCDYIFKYKKIILHLLSELNIYYNKDFIIQYQKILNNKKDTIKSLVSFVLDEYNKIFEFVYNTENYIIDHKNYEFYDLDYEIQTNYLNSQLLDYKLLPFQDLNIIFSDVIAYELFYDYKINKFDIIKLIKYLNNKIQIKDLIKRDINCNILVFHTPGDNKGYNSTTEGLFKIIDD